MSKPKAQSGLGSIKRDWSITSSNPPKSSQEIEWLPTPPKQAPSQPTASSSASSSSRPMTGKERRLMDIQNALEGRSTPAVAAPAVVQPFAQPPKRLSDEHNASYPPAKKPRQLPPGYRDDAGPSSNFYNSGQGAKVQSTYTAPPPSKKVSAVFLSQEQTKILKLVQEGNSVFYTGSAGTGKSVLLREIIKTLRKKHSRAADAVAITASTGIAACNIGGVTIHSFGGIGIGTESADSLAMKIRRNKKALARWQRTKVLIIDEVSMLDGDLFDKLSRIGSILRKDVNPFGGIQLIVTGDFFQLPPVTKNGASVKFAFEAQLWSQTIKRTFNLTKVFRQHDQEFVDMLNEMRFGNLSQKSIDKFRSLSREIRYTDGLGPTELFPLRGDVDKSNNVRMERLDTPMQTFRANDGGAIQDPEQRERLLNNFMAVTQLQLREGAQVMLIKNMDETLVNGSMGRVVRFVDPAVYGTERDIDGAGAETLSSAAAGPGPVKKPTPVAAGTTYPVVEFALANGGKRTLMVDPQTFKTELPTGEVQVSRTQLPLILAWAMSIHKSQGQTLDRVKVDLGKVFEKGLST